MLRTRVDHVLPTFHNHCVSTQTQRQTRYLDVSAMVQLVAKVGARSVLRRLVEDLSVGFKRWHDFEKSARVASHSEVGVIELMPVADLERFAFKYVNGHPQNPSVGLPTVMAFGVLADVETGYPLFISEMTLLTAFRTAATSALAARAMARPDSRRMAMIGNGAQSEFQILAFREVLGIETFTLFDIDPSATEKLIRNLASQTDIELIPCANVDEAVEQADIITTSTADKSLAQILDLSHLRPGVHLNAIGGDCPGKTELHPHILTDAHVVVEFAPQSRIEGEVQQLAGDVPVIELWEVLTGAVPGRPSNESITLFDSVGFALEDYVALSTIYSLAVENHLGETLDLIPDLKNVKDLYALIA